MSGETEANVSGWTVDTLGQFVRTMFTEHDVRFEQRFQSQEQNVQIAITSQEKAISAALAAADKAVAKSEIAMEKRFDSVNEFRGQLADQARDFMPRKEYEVQHQALADRITANENHINESSAHRKGIQDGWGYFVGAVGAFIGVAGLIIAFTR